MGLSGISTPFEVLSQIIRQIIYALLTRAPLSWRASSPITFDLHVLGTPPAFVLSQDQTLQFVNQKSLNCSKTVLKIINLRTHNLFFLLFSFQRPNSLPARCDRSRTILEPPKPVNNFFPAFFSGQHTARKRIAFIPTTIISVNRFFSIFFSKRLFPRHDAVLLRPAIVIFRHFP